MAVDGQKVATGFIIALVVIMVLVGQERFTRTSQKIMDKGLVETVGESLPESSGEGGVIYTPPGIPLSIVIDTSGRITLSCRGKIPTPIGTFEIYRNIDFPQKKTLTVVVGDKKTIYDLEDKAFAVKLPNDLEGKSKVEYDGKGNILVVVPKPVP